MFNSRPLDFDPMATLAVQSDLALRAIEAERRATHAEDQLLAVQGERDRLAAELADLRADDGAPSAAASASNPQTPSPNAAAA